MSFSQLGEIDFSGETGAIHWPSGRNLTSDGSSITANGNLLATGGMRSTGYTTRVGGSDKQGQTGSFIDQGGSTITVKGGIITNGL